ncbi:TerD family protein [Neisseriaceae bacterium ESL0693]|nr:TerD family protein [Neisseriaceae bacterium ESL0693]
MNLPAGGNILVPSSNLHICITSSHPIDAAAFRLFENNKVDGDDDMVFYGQPCDAENSICLTQNGSKTAFAVSLTKLKPQVQKIAFTINCDAGKKLSSLNNLTIQVNHQNTSIAEGVVELSDRQEAALILGELYRYKEGWKFRFIAQGFNGGLKPLAEHFGIEVADERKTAPDENRMSSSAASDRQVVLDKVCLTKDKPMISLAKRSDFGKININLNWSLGNQPTNKLSKIFKRKNIDLDLGAFVELQDGSKTVVQALGETFGHYDEMPFVQLSGDDRSGEVADGEWLYVNGAHWKNIRQILIYAFIYDGVPNWNETDATVTLYIPRHPPIETRLIGGDYKYPMCAIAQLVNVDGTIKVERINRYFYGHSDMDNAFGWGFRWQAGTK